MGGRIANAVAAACLATALAASFSAARAAEVEAAAAEDGDLVALGLGGYDVLHNYTAAQARVEYRFHESLLYIQPLLGVLGTNRKTVYAYFGLRSDILFFQHYVLMPVEAVGYFNQGNGKVLGSHIEFKSGLELAYRFDGGSRLGLAFDHISNAGITAKNPGTESLLLVWSFPLQF